MVVRDDAAYNRESKSGSLSPRKTAADELAPHGRQFGCGDSDSPVPHL